MLVIIKSTYHIVYLNGPSSSGKTTIARALQNRLSEPFLVIGIDQVIIMMPAKLNDWDQETQAPGFSFLPEKDQQGHTIAYKLHTGPYGKRMVTLLEELVLTMARAGHDVIVDDVSFGKKGVDAWRDVLKEYKVLWVGVTASVDVLERREKERGDRIIGSARWQAERVHAGVVYDLMVHTDTHTSEAIVDTIEHALTVDAL